MTGEKIQFKTEPLHSGDINVEDGGMAKIATLYQGEDIENGIFVRVQSWSEEKSHQQFDDLIKPGKSFRVIIEEIIPEVRT